MIVNQPYEKQLGLEIIDQLQSIQYDSITIIVAYAKLSGVYRLLPYLKEFRSRNGKIKCIIGVDQQNTTYDAIKQIASIADELYIFHSECFSQTFHVKCYWLSGSSSLWYAIGSNNWTAGGLFSNYEMSISEHLCGSECTNMKKQLEKIFQAYSMSSNECCKPVTDELLHEILHSGYVISELDQRKALARVRKTEIVDAKKLFGREQFHAPLLSSDYTKTGNVKKPVRTVESVSQQKIPQIVPTGMNTISSDYLIRLIPRAGNRSKQVHFTQDLLHRYFNMEASNSILLQELLSTGDWRHIEYRRIVLSQVNGNVKIEMAGASVLDEHYPENLQTRPVLIIKRIDEKLFAYMLLLDGDDGYASINKRLRAQPNGRSLPSEVIDEATMFDLWGNCPLV